MNDRQLLELAAKASRIEWIKSAVNWGGLLLSDHSVWNPLTSNSDAFFLAAKLGVKVDFENCFVVVQKNTESGGVFEFMVSWHKFCDIAVIRHSITKVAAQIGELK